MIDVRNEARGIVSAAGIGVAGLLVLSRFIPYNPVGATIDQLSVPLTGTLVVGAVALMMLGSRIRALVMVAVAILSGAQAWLDVRSIPVAMTVFERPSHPIRIASLNLLNTNTSDPKEIEAAVIALDADVLSLQEARPLRPVLAEMQQRYPYRFGCSDDGPCDSMILSRLPMGEVTVRSLSIIFPDRYLQTTITTPNGSFEFVSVHLVKSYIDTFVWMELHQFRELMNKVDGPVVVAGDLNAAPWSTVVGRMTSENGLERSATMPSTWPVAMGPYGFAIDHLFVRGDVALSSLKGVVMPGSNHRGIVGDVLIPARETKDTDTPAPRP